MFLSQVKIDKSYQTILVARNVDADHLLQTEVPNKLGVDEWCNKASRSGVDCVLSAKIVSYVVL